MRKSRLSLLLVCLSFTLFACWGSAPKGDLTSGLGGGSSSSSGASSVSTTPPEGGSSKGEETSLEITPFPAMGEKRVDPATNISAKFSVPMDASSISDKSFTVTGPSGPIRGTVSYDFETASFLPAEVIPRTVSLTATLSRGIRDATGNALAEDFSWSFSIRDGRWGEEQKIGGDPMAESSIKDVDFSERGLDEVRTDSSTAGVASDWIAKREKATPQVTPMRQRSEASVLKPQIASSPDGVVMAVWQQETSYMKATGSYGRHVSLVCNQFVPGVGWKGPKRLGTSREGDSKNPQIVADQKGNFTVVWEQKVGGGTSYIAAKRYLSATGTWEETVYMDIRAGEATNPHVAVNASGDAVIVWEYRTSEVPNAVYAGWYHLGGKPTGEAHAILQSEMSPASNPAVVIDDEGNAIAVWLQSDGKSDHVMCNRFDAKKSKWEDKATLLDREPGMADHPRIAMDRKGNAMVVWSQYQWKVMEANAFALRFDASTQSWSVPEGVGSMTSGARLPGAISVGRGGFLAHWQESAGLMARRWNSETGTWASEMPFLMGGNGQGISDERGNILMVSENFKGSLFSRRYLDGDEDWLMDAKFLEKSELDSSFARLCVDSFGVVTAVWEGWDGKGYTVWANRYE